MDTLFTQASIADVHQDLVRNIVSLDGQDLYDDLSDDRADWELAQRVEAEHKPAGYVSRTPIIDRPFEDATWCTAIGFPFTNWQKSRFSDGSFGVWYGSDSVVTTAYETAHHWFHGFLADADFCIEGVVAERRVFWVRCDAALLDFRPLVANFPGLVDPRSYAFTQPIGARLHREGHPGLATKSARCTGDNFAILNPAVLSDPRHCCYLGYQFVDGEIVVEKQRGQRLMAIPV